MLVLTEDWVDKNALFVLYLALKPRLKAVFRIRIRIDFALLDPDLDPEQEIGQN